MRFLKKGHKESDKSQNHKPNRQRGITFVEMSVSLAVLSIIMSSLVFYHRGFTDRLEITNLAYDIALTIREAQVSGSAVRGTDLGGFDHAFGIRFFIGGSGGNIGSDKAFISFVDLSNGVGGDPDGLYNGNFNCRDEECIRKIEIGRGNFIKKVCWRENNSSLKCNSNTNSSPPRGVDITFLRPKLDATTKFLTYGGGWEGEGQVINNDGREAVICLESPQGGKKTVHVLPTGQIFVGEDNCPTVPGPGL